MMMMMVTIIWRRRTSFSLRTMAPRTRPPDGRPKRAHFFDLLIGCGWLTTPPLERGHPVSFVSFDELIEEISTENWFELIDLRWVSSSKNGWKNKNKPTNKRNGKRRELTKKTRPHPPPEMGVVPVRAHSNPFSWRASQRQQCRPSKVDGRIKRRPLPCNTPAQGVFFSFPFFSLFLLFFLLGFTFVGSTFFFILMGLVGVEIVFLLVFRFRFTEFYWVLLGFTWYYSVLLAFIGFYWVLLGFNGY